MFANNKDYKKWLSARHKGDLKEMAKQQYNEVALLSTAKASKCCCSPAVSSKKVFTVMSEDYSEIKGYEPEADFIR